MAPAFIKLICDVVNDCGVGCGVDCGMSCDEDCGDGCCCTCCRCILAEGGAIVDADEVIDTGTPFVCTPFVLMDSKDGGI